MNPGINRNILFRIQTTFTYHRRLNYTNQSIYTILVWPLRSNEHNKIYYITLLYFYLFIHNIIYFA